MKIEGFIWLEDVVEKLLAKHRVTPSEVEEVFSNSPAFRFVEKGHRPKENVYAASGRSDAGRRLICFFVHKQGNQVLVLSARDMTDSERKRYEKK